MPYETRSVTRRNSQTNSGGGDIAPTGAQADRVTRRARGGGTADQDPHADRVTTRSAGRGGRRGGTRGGHLGTMAREMRPVVDDLDNDPGHGEKLQARSGCLGTVSSRGWEARTNFLIDVNALINSSSTYKLKGRLNKVNPFNFGRFHPI